MTIAGNLKTMDLAELLQWLSQGHKTGTLVIDGGRVEKRIFLRQGKIISSASTDPQEQLGHFLVSQGYISELELAKAIEMQEANRMLLGKIMVTLGAISEEELHQMLRFKAEESIYDIFMWREGEFRFLDGELPSHDLIPMDLEVTAIVLEGARRQDEWQRIREVIPSSDCVPVSVGNLDDPGLPPGAKRILSLVNDDRTVEEIRLQTHSSEFYVCQVLFQEIQRRRIKIIRPRRSDAAQPITQVTGVLDAKALLERGHQYLEQADYERSLRNLRAARDLEPENRNVMAAAEAGERLIQKQLESEGLLAAAVPRLTRNLAEMTHSQIGPQEGFMLSRINGSYNIQSIIKISPMPPLDALMVFWKLRKAGLIELG